VASTPLKTNITVLGNGDRRESDPAEMDPRAAMADELNRPV